MKYVLLIFLSILFISCDSNGCTNPDCSFAYLTPPLVLVSKSYNNITLKDATGKIWVSETDWDVAKSILVEGYRIGDTIGKPKIVY